MWVRVIGRVPQVEKEGKGNEEERGDSKDSVVGVISPENWWCGVSCPSGGINAFY